ncbi:hypothetical protein BRADI_5g22205v3 [Brachypodium distachyon]|uniref:Uncharacterized protein n=1 Tax=Brachypodium distachyon TaxID=15368 RepID=A0A2K2CIN2_BRADI|nr:hypothetical protein BRADI_5g22205v3 [Brachypodium distachyon]
MKRFARILTCSAGVVARIGLTYSKPIAAQSLCRVMIMLPGPRKQRFHRRLEDSQAGITDILRPHEPMIPHTTHTCEIAVLEAPIYCHASSITASFTIFALVRTKSTYICGPEWREPPPCDLPLLLFSKKKLY